MKKTETEILILKLITISFEPWQFKYVGFLLLTFGGTKNYERFARTVLRDILKKYLFAKKEQTINRYSVIDLDGCPVKGILAKLKCKNVCEYLMFNSV